MNWVVVLYRINIMTQKSYVLICCSCVFIFFFSLQQRCQTYGSWAKTGPPRNLIRPTDTEHSSPHCQHLDCHCAQTFGKRYTPHPPPREEEKKNKTKKKQSVCKVSTNNYIKYLVQEMYQCGLNMAAKFLKRCHNAFWDNMWFFSTGTQLFISKDTVMHFLATRGATSISLNWALLRVSQ